MKAVIQRVLSASVSVDGKNVSEIGKGICVLVGIGTDDGPADSEYIISKILNLRLFPTLRESIAGENETDSEAPWKRSVVDIGGDVLCVSQFTLMAVTTKGSKPDFHNAMPSTLSETMYSTFLQKMRTTYRPDRIKDGEFGAMMNVSLTNEGPVTIILDSKAAPSISSVNAEQARRNAKEKAKKTAELEARTEANRVARDSKARVEEQHDGIQQ